MTEDIRTEVKDFVMREFLPGEDPHTLTNDLPLISGGILDSIATLKLILHLEETYGIAFEAHDVDRTNFDTLDRIVAMVVSKRT
jgi:acyl carrier protein